MVKMKNIHPLSDFLRNSKSRIGQLKSTGEHSILTVNGQAEVVVMSAESYEKLIEELEQEKTLDVAGNGTLEALRSGQISVKELKASLQPNPAAAAIPAKEAFAEIERRIQLRRKKKAS